MTDATPEPPPAGVADADTALNLWRSPDGLPADHVDANAKRAFVLGIVGDSGSGKNTVADAVAHLLGPDRVTDVRLDDYHRFTRAERAERNLTALNPAVHNLELMQEHLRLLRQRRPIRNRSYDHEDGTFGEVRTIPARDIVLVRGLLGFPTEQLREVYDLTVFIQPEPELLFRWKLRRDVLFRGYTEAQVLKYIAAHLLESKEFVLPQAGEADVLVRYSLPDWEAPDSSVETIVQLRGDAAEAARSGALLVGLSAQPDEAGDEVHLRIDPELPRKKVDDWARGAFPTTYDAGAVGVYFDEAGEVRHRAPLALVEVLIARLATLNDLTAKPRRRPKDSK